MTERTTPNPTWYDILGVAPDAQPDEIKAAWRVATDKFEPGSGTSQFRLFNEAADVLLDPERRKAYDAELAGETAVPAEPAAPAEEADDEPARAAADEAGAGAAADIADAEVEPGPEAGPEGEPEVRPAGVLGGPLGFLGRLGDVVVAVIAALAVGSLVLTAYLGVRIHDRVTVADAGPDASASAERALKAVLSYDYRHMEADRDRAATYLTPKYRKEYLKNFNDLLTKGPDGSPGPVEKTKAVVTADVLDTGVVDAESDRVRVVVFVNQSSVKGGGQPTIFQDRVVATMVHDGDDWLVDNIKSY